jgi:hypothetical protein
LARSCTRTRRAQFNQYHSLATSAQLISLPLGNWTKDPMVVQQTPIKFSLVQTKSDTIIRMITLTGFFNNLTKIGCFKRDNIKRVVKLMYNERHSLYPPFLDNNPIRRVILTKILSKTENKQEKADKYIFKSLKS